MALLRSSSYLASYFSISSSISSSSSSSSSSMPMDPCFSLNAKQYSEVHDEPLMATHDPARIVSRRRPRLSTLIVPKPILTTTQLVFSDESKGIVCYRDESGEVICEGFDEGPYYPPQPSPNQSCIQLSMMFATWKNKNTYVGKNGNDKHTFLRDSTNASYAEGIDEG